MLSPVSDLMMSDADGDSTMQSSPELAADDEMFPDEAGPSTPRNAASFSLDPASELSPPNSQGGPSNVPRDESFPAALAGTPTALNANGKRIRASAALTSAVGSGNSSAVQTDAVTGYQWSKAEDQPGYEWKNTRAREDEARAMEQIVDRASQIKSEKSMLCFAGQVADVNTQLDTGTR